MGNKSYQVLRRKSDFEKLFSSGRRIYPSTWMTLNVAPNGLQSLRCGWTVPRKVGNAVIRNKLKRWCRLYFQSKPAASEQLETHLDINVVFRGVPQSPQFYRRLLHQDFLTCLDRGWRKAQTVCESKPSSKTSPRAN